MITVTLLAESGSSLLEGGEELLDTPGLKWIDLQGQTEANMAPLVQRLGLHKLAVEDCFHLDQRPKIEQYPNHHFVVTHSFSASPQNVCELTLHELHLFIGKDWILSVHADPMKAVDDARSRFRADPPSFSRGPDFLTYALLDAAVDTVFPLLDEMFDTVETLEEQIFEHGSTHEQLERMFELKRTMVTLRRVLSPQRDVLSLLVRGGGFVSERTTLYFRDVYDHLTRVHEQLESARELLGNARDAYLSAVANKTNDITKQLTIFATIFLPLSFITGFFGQNFERLSSRFFFWVMIFSIIALPITLVGWFRHKRWV